MSAVNKTRIQKLFENPEFRKDYSAWLKDGVTVQLLEAAQDLSEPQSLVRPDPNAALYLHGVYVGFNKMLSFLRNAEKVSEVAEQAELPDDYGAERILAAMFPHLNKVKKRRASATPETPVV